MTRYKLISWNVNGLRAALRKGFVESMTKLDPDMICLQETKAQQGQAEVNLPIYEEYWNSAKKKGYSGTAIFTKHKPLKIINDIQLGEHKPEELVDKYGDANSEGRVIAAEYDKFYVVSVYTPNSKQDLTRLDYRYKAWDPIFLKYMKELEKHKPVIFCGDLNVAHEEIDLARPDDNHHNHGFTDEEREGFGKILEAGFVDTFRMFNKEGGNYSWWTPWRDARAKNVGWRIDYFCVSKSLKDNVKSAAIHKDIMGSDHCPIEVVVEI